jgi:hypothetical protein
MREGAEKARPAWACGLAFCTLMLEHLCLQVVLLAPGSAFSIITAAASLRKIHKMTSQALNDKPAKLADNPVKSQNNNFLRLKIHESILLQEFLAIRRSLS